MSSSQINLAWTAASDNVGVTSYRIERCQGTGCATTPSNFVQIGTVNGTPPATTYNNSTGLAANTPYSYRILATDAVPNLSDYSNVATATTPGGSSDTQKPTPPPSSLTATPVSSSQINLAWTAASDNVGVTSYRIERCQGTGCATTPSNFVQIGTVNGTPPATTYNDSTGLAANTPYSYRILATDAVPNLSDYSNVATATTQGGGGGGPGFANDTVVQNLNLVTCMVFLPDGKMLMGQINGTIKLVQKGAIDADPTPFNVIANAVAQGDAGLHDITLDPNFSTNNYYYVFYAHALGASYRDRVSRFTAAAGWNSTVPGSEVVLWEDDVQNTDSHHGATVAFGPDGKLYISIGDNGQASDPQSLTSYHGKILRINPDGSIPADNPFIDGQGGNKDEIWAYGFRNPYRFSFDSVTGNLYEGDVGGNNQQTSIEELNLVVRGADYGWPLCEGPCGIAGMTGPIYWYQHPGTHAAIMGGFVYRGSAYPSEYRGNYFFADYAQKFVKRLTLNPSGTAVTGVFNFEPANGAAGDPSVGDPVQLRMGPDGALYYLDLSFNEQAGSFNAGTLRRMRYLGAGNQPPVVVANATPLQGPSPPLDVSFSSTGTYDPDGGTLSFSWDFGDGSISTEASPVHTYSARGQYQATLTVSDGADSAFKSISIVVGDPPTAVIQSPANGLAFKAGDHILIQGDGKDFQGNPLPDSALSWTVVFRHEQHVHPGIGPIVGVRSFTFDIPTSGHDFSGNTRYEVILTVTDPDGVQRTSSVTIYPDKVNLNVDTLPSGLTVMLDGISNSTPFVIDSLKGFVHTLAAPDQAKGSTGYTFVSWSDSGAQGHDITTPEQPTSYIATFSGTPLPTPAGLVAAYSFDQGSGTTVPDASGTNNTGTLAGATWTTSGKYGGALAFSGTNQRVNIPNAASLQLSSAMTLEAWVNPSTISNVWRDVVFKGNDNYFLMATTGPAHAGTPAGGAIVNGAHAEAFGTTTLTTGTFTHLAATYDGATLKLYVGGNLVGSKAATGAIMTSTNQLQIGGDSIYGQYFAGVIDEVRVYNTALTQAQIQTDMTTPIGSGGSSDTQKPTPPPSSLTATPVSSSQINLAWTAASDNVGVTSYRIERCQGTGCATTPSNFVQIGTVNGTPPATTYNNSTGLAANTPYSYRILATDAVPNLSDYSNVATATTPGGSSDTQKPTPPPSSLTATPVSSSQINLAWTAASDNVGVTSYRIERCQGTGCATTPSNFVQIGTVNGTPPATTYNDSTGLAANTPYSYRILATDAVPNLSDYSNVATATTAGTSVTLTFVQVNSATPQTNQSTVKIIYTGAQTAGNTNILAIGWNDATSNISSVTDTAGNTYQVAAPTARGTGLSQAIYYAKNIKAAPAGGNTVTVTFTTAVRFADIRISEYSGLSVTNPLDVTASASGTVVLANSGNVTTTSASELIFGAGITARKFTAAGAGFTQRIITTPDGDITEDRTVNAVGTYNATAPLNGTGGWVMQVATFRAGP